MTKTGSWTGTMSKSDSSSPPSPGATWQRRYFFRWLSISQSPDPWGKACWALWLQKGEKVRSQFFDGFVQIYGVGTFLPGLLMFFHPIAARTDVSKKLEELYVPHQNVLILGASLYLSKGIVNVGVGCSVIEILLTFGLIKVFFLVTIMSAEKNFQYLALELNLFKKKSLR